MFFIIDLGYSTNFKSAESANLGVNSTKNINFRIDLPHLKKVALFVAFEKYEIIFNVLGMNLSYSQSLLAIYTENI